MFYEFLSLSQTCYAIVVLYLFQVLFINYCETAESTEDKVWLSENSRRVLLKMTATDQRQRVRPGTEIEQRKH